ncbi:hypothetical protein D5018_11575 [Parashewanella curva]|uniref:Uncharacterized protein n=1 Tax=Parashewanella curva TaxID=2338552 RepID=A0A3L8PZI7_9GAMM|nr:sugar dehydrogenase complex small subunit [Parashewanella curva]RLV59502.1 hypothetical protein D5018_11575 [Parashewanella curva]
MLTRRETLSLIASSLGFTAFFPQWINLAVAGEPNQPTGFLYVSSFLTGFTKINESLVKPFHTELIAQFGHAYCKKAIADLESSFRKASTPVELTQILQQYRSFSKAILKLWFLGKFLHSKPALDVQDLAYQQGLIWQIISATPPCVPDDRDWSVPPAPSLKIAL